MQEELDRLRQELLVTDGLVDMYKQVLGAIPPCPEHGLCVPHALEWIAKAKLALEEREAANLARAYYEGRLRAEPVFTQDGKLVSVSLVPT